MQFSNGSYINNEFGKAKDNQNFDQRSLSKNDSQIYENLDQFVLNEGHNIDGAFQTNINDLEDIKSLNSNNALSKHTTPKQQRDVDVIPQNYDLHYNQSVYQPDGSMLSHGVSKYLA